jgi:PST family polysaccharide transporter
VRDPNHDPRRDAPILFLSLVATNGLLVVAIWLGAPLIVHASSELADRGVQVLQVLSLTLLFGGMGQVSEGMIRRALDFRFLGLRSLAVFVMGQGLVAIPLACLGFGVWSVVSGVLVQTALGTILSWWRSPHRPWPVGGERLDLRRLMRLCGSFSALRAADSAGIHLLPLVVAVLAGTAAVGLWDRSVILIALPLTILSTGFSQVLFAALSRMTEDRSRLPHILEDLLLVGPALGPPVAFGMAVAATDLVPVILGPDWTGAAPVLAWIGLWLGVKSLAELTGPYCEALGWIGRRLAQQGIYLFVLGVTLALVRPETSWEVARLLALLEIPAQIALVAIAALGVGRPVLRTLSVLVAGLFPALVVVLGCAATVWLGEVLAWPPVARLVFEIIVCALCLGLGLLFHPVTQARRLVYTYVFGSFFGMGRPEV